MSSQKYSMDEEFSAQWCGQCQPHTTRTHRCKEDPAFVAKDTKARLRVLRWKFKKKRWRTRASLRIYSTVRGNWYDLFPNPIAACGRFSGQKWMALQRSWEFKLRNIALFSSHQVHHNLSWISVDCSKVDKQYDNSKMTSYQSGGPAYRGEYNITRRHMLCVPVDCFEKHEIAKCRLMGHHGYWCCCGPLQQLEWLGM